MRRFTSYGPVDKDLDYYAPREELINLAHTQLIGEAPEKGGYYITVWGPRQSGKTWIMQQVLRTFQADERFDVVKVNLEHLKMERDLNEVIIAISEEILMDLSKDHVEVKDLKGFYNLFMNKKVLDKPLILIMDEFDALPEEAINGIVSVLRNIYIQRRDDHNSIWEKKCFLHGVALIGVRRVLGVDNQTGSPFNVQRSLHIPNLTYEEVESMFKCYEKETAQGVDEEVIDRLFYETQGQPGLTCWFGELLTEQFNKDKAKSISMEVFKQAYIGATLEMPNNNILNIISKANQEPYKDLVLELFRTDNKIYFRYEDQKINFLYMNGVVAIESEDSNRYLKFSSPFIQKKLFNFFSNELFSYTGKLYDPFEDLESIITEEELNIKNLMIRYEGYLKDNSHWLLKDAPRRSDMKIYEAVYHFNLYMYLFNFLGYGKNVTVYPEFPTGNGKIDIIIRYRERVYGIEIKTYTDRANYKDALYQAAKYGKALEIEEISLVFFVEIIDDQNREIFEKDYMDEETGVLVRPVFVQTQ